jgi:hypothetical protein
MRVICVAALISVPTLSEAAGLVRGTGSRSVSHKAAKVGGAHHKPIARHRWAHPWAYRRYFAVPNNYSYPYADGPDFLNDLDFLNDQMFAVEVPEPPRVLNCKRTREVRTVPTAAGGTREITITRC